MAPEQARSEIATPPPVASEEPDQAARYPWMASFPDICNWNAPLETTTLPELLAEAVRQQGSAPALEFRGRTVSYEVLEKDVERLDSG